MSDVRGQQARDGHPIALLQELCDLCSGITKGRKISSTETLEVPYMAVANVQDGKLSLDNVKTINATPEEIKRYRLLPGDLLLTEGGDPDKLGRGAIWNGEIDVCIHQNHIFRARKASNHIDMRYLSRLVSSPYGKRYFLRQSKQTTGIASINMAQLKRFPVPLPPLEEQRRIAAILDQSKDISLKSRLSNELASSLIESEMIQRFGRPGSNQARSDCLSLVDAGVLVIDCPHSTPKWTEEGKICLRTSNLGKGDWIWQDTRRISDHDFQERSRRAPLEPGDIVLSREGTVGIAAIVTYGMEVCMGQRLVQLKLDASCLMPEYLLAQLLYLLKPYRISHAMTGSTSKHINVKDLRELKIYCPPLEEQREFEAFCRSAKMLRAKIDALGEKLDLLERSIQAASF